MKVTTTVGYVVVGGWDCYVLGSERVLWLGRTATLFRERRHAKAAIARTLNYSKRNALRWPDDYRIKRVTVAVTDGR